MKLIIFAGGVGTRLWPLSRKSLPKQFIKMFNGKSTLQMAVERVKETFGMENIIISTNEQYVSMVKAELSEIPVSNIVGEPEKRDLGSAVGLNLMRLKKQGYKGPVALLWADHLIKNVSEYLNLLKVSRDYVIENPEKLVFVGEEPRFAWDNGGWIKFGKKIEGKFFEYKEWVYKPGMEKSAEMFKSGEWVWNSGYVVEDLDFALSLFKKFQPELCEGLDEIYRVLGTEGEAKVIKEIYPNLPKISHDAAISQNVSPDQAVVYCADMGWSDPGTLYALKEALIPNESDNLEYGLTSLTDSKDTMIYNLENDKLVVGIGLNGMVVVNTKDVILVVPKNKVLQISKLVDSLGEDSKFKGFV
ncbi:MAG: sugar phosphate nucleotidyltransferase [Patescibacteria group bacterium]